MDIVSPRFRQVGRALGQIIVVAGRNKNLRPNRGKKAFQRIEGIAVDPCAVKQIARQQHKVASLTKLCQLFQNAALFASALRCLFRRQGGKRGI